MRDTAFAPRVVLVTGGAGFIGSNFVHYVLAHCGETRVVNMDCLTYAGNLENLTDVADEPRYTFARVDICEREAVIEVCRRYEVDSIVHFAAESHVDRSISGPSPFIRANVGGTLSLLEAARECALPVIACNGFLPGSLKSTGPDADHEAGDVAENGGTASALDAVTGVAAERRALD